MWPQVSRNETDVIWSSELSSFRNAKQFAIMTNHERKSNHTMVWCWPLRVALLFYHFSRNRQLSKPSLASYQQPQENTSFSHKKVAIANGMLKKVLITSHVDIRVDGIYGSRLKNQSFPINGKSIILYSLHWQGSPCMWSRPYM